jgi:nicotinamidase-related amidase
MINGKQFKMVTDKFMSSPTVQNARVKSLASSLSYLYEGNKIEELVACGLALDACCSKLDACCLLLESLGA